MWCWFTDIDDLEYDFGHGHMFCEMHVCEIENGCYFQALDILLSGLSYVT